MIMKNLIQQQVTELGTKLFLAKVWVEDCGAKISATVWTLEDASKGKAILVKPKESEKTQNGNREDAKPECGKTQVGKANVTKADDGKADVGKANGLKAGDEKAKVGKATDEKTADEQAEGGKGEDEKGYDGTLKGGNPDVGIVAPAHCRI